MPNEDEKPPAPSTETIAVNPRATPEVATSLPPIDPETLIQGLRYLQRRITGLEHLSLRERQSMARAAHLDPEFLEAGIQAADAWDSAKSLIGMSGPELRQENDEIRRWDQVEIELTALLKGVADANLKRKHRLGKAILRLYFLLGREYLPEAMTHLRPHYEHMKQAYHRTLRKGAGRRKRAGRLYLARTYRRTKPGSFRYSSWKRSR